MGYETQLLIGVNTNTVGRNGTYFMIYAHIDMCVLGKSNLFTLPYKNNSPETEKWFFYAPYGDGDTRITTDPYGKYPRPVPISDVIAAIEEDLLNSGYRRLTWALDLLKSMNENSSEALSVLLWGH